MAATTSLLARAASAISDKASLPIRAAAAATVAVGTLFGAHIASGQQLVDNAPPSALGATAKQPAAATVLPDAQCRTARAISSEILQRYTGRMSAELARGFGEFGRTCDLATRFERVPGTADDSAWGEFRVRIIALRMSAANGPSTFAQK